ncbi:phage N-6-adenine-methyltransferase [Nocardioides KLBMP 9356]|uniref:Phage N-6-adenine-methyltransferase n=1 Tax=Nocardioides potassii TaxID=2911371 RepID=A0ABS9HA88_9ACTN|nr:phage N-6-adenine-methyltransferase [Nocardioides potassii]MCF6376928.1 phage N-6-adenine-methyltransferase [Nocardioides potassii]
MSRINEGMFTSDRLDWATPQGFFDLVAREFPFTLDAAASPNNAKVNTFYTEADDALAQPWPGIVWCNPPYGRGIGKWVHKGWSESQTGSTVVMLIPARTDTSWWHEYVMCAAEVRLVRGRLVFGQGEATSNAPFPCALVVFRPGQSSPVFSAMERGLLNRRAA